MAMSAKSCMGWYCLYRCAPTTCRKGYVHLMRPRGGSGAGAHGIAGVHAGLVTHPSVGTNHRDLRDPLDLLYLQSLH